MINDLKDQLCWKYAYHMEVEERLILEDGLKIKETRWTDRSV